ncbi:hypothetical protein GCM10011581_50160 [Saccharopolyspora subtropica]|uniref:Uncharacterized protein n=1 Tax=Saccharopolyspora thermophila TaxID=89367 RepID=A0A917KE53_9PSEU|nr:hypothetical protein [Saccharopolyspora subtropica]GGJ07213.1 hypothetical protein GCM10011581_50160 [Saccharopolyspora subtropica]
MTEADQEIVMTEAEREYHGLQRCFGKDLERYHNEVLRALTQAYELLRHAQGPAMRRYGKQLKMAYARRSAFHEYDVIEHDPEWQTQEKQFEAFEEVFEMLDVALRLWVA